MDDIDKRILQALQTDADASIAEIAERAGVSQTPCWKRIKRLEEKGIIKKRVALLNAEAVGVPMVGFVQIKAGKHSEKWLDGFTSVIGKIPEIVECHRMTGDIDYLLKIVCPDVSGYDDIYKRLIKISELSDVSVSFSMEQLKETTELPLHYA